MRNLYSMKKYWCQVQVSWLRLPRPSAPPTSLPELLTVTLLCITRVVLKISAIVLFPFFSMVSPMMLTFHTGRRGDVFSVVAHIKFLPLPKQLETRSGATQTSGWRSWRKQIPAIEITFRWMIWSFAGPYLCQLAAHPPLALVLFFCSLFLE